MQKRVQVQVLSWVERARVPPSQLQNACLQVIGLLQQTSLSLLPLRKRQEISNQLVLQAISQKQGHHNLTGSSVLKCVSEFAIQCSQQDKPDLYRLDDRITAIGVRFSKYLWVRASERTHRRPQSSISLLEFTNDEATVLPTDTSTTCIASLRYE